jgi:hypothetical protein
MAADCLCRHGNMRAQSTIRGVAPQFLTDRSG